MNKSQMQEEAFDYGRLEIFNSDQGSPFISNDFINELLSNYIQISMDGGGRIFDNIFIERLWRSVKYENIYVRECQTVADVRSGLKKYFKFYNTDR